MRLRPRSLALLAVTSVPWACGSRAVGPDPAPAPAPAPAAAPAPDPSAAAEPSEAPPAAVAETSAASDPGAEDAGAAQESPLQGRALEACQAAGDLLAQGDAAGAMGRIDEAYGLMLQIPDAGDEAAQAKQDIRRMVASLIGRVYGGARPRGTGEPSQDLAMPTVDNEFVAREIQSFTGRERGELLAAFQRAGRWRPMILQKLEAAGLPSQLSWLPMVESFFTTTALSRASALGLWQFISSTGLRYGLIRDDAIDERLDPEKSTDAAVAYLADLHLQFGDWPKALAAYNCGETKVAQLQQRAAGQFVDFWDLHALMPQETRRYVPRFIAVLEILTHPERYGLKLPEPDPPVAAARVTVAKPVKLASLDAALGLAAGTLAGLNPALRTDGTPHRAFELAVPTAAAERVPEAVSGLAEYSAPRAKFVVHRVRSGETLSQIASHYYVSVNAIMRTNKLRSARLIFPGQRLIIPDRS